jgi:hypothetical protein
MKKYRVTTSCIGREFNRRFFEKGEIIDVDDDVDLSSDACFELIDKVVVKKEEPVTHSFSELQGKQTELANPNSGFASNISKIEPVRKPGRPKKGR